MDLGQQSITDSITVVYNTRDEKVKIRAFGSYHTFKPKQMITVDHKRGYWIATKRAYEGFVQLPINFLDPSYAKTKEGKEILAAKTKEGINNHIKYLRMLMNNALNSLKSDLETKNIKADPRVFASDAELEAMEKLANYRKAEQDEKQAKVDRIKKLESELG